MNAPMSVILFHGDIHQGTRSEITTFVWTCRAYSRPLFGTTNAPNLVPWVLENLSSLKIIKNDIYLVGAGKQNAIFFKRCDNNDHKI